MFWYFFMCGCKYNHSTLLLLFLLFSDFYCLVTSGVIKATEGQNISVWIKATGDNSYGVSQDSTFSIVYISALDSIYGSAASLMLDRSISQAKKQATGWKKALYWRKARPYTAPSVFQIGKMTSFVCVRVSNGGNSLRGTQ